MHRIRPKLDEQGCGRSWIACKSNQLRRTVCHSSLTTDPERRPDVGATGGPRRTPVPAGTAGPMITSCSRRARFDALRAAAFALIGLTVSKHSQHSALSMFFKTGLFTRVRERFDDLS